MPNANSTRAASDLLIRFSSLYKSARYSWVFTDRLRANTDAADRGEMIVDAPARFFSRSISRRNRAHPCRARLGLPESVPHLGPVVGHVESALRARMSLQREMRKPIVCQAMLPNVSSVSGARFTRFKTLYSELASKCGSNVRIRARADIAAADDRRVEVMIGIQLRCATVGNISSGSLRSARPCPPEDGAPFPIGTARSSLLGRGPPSLVRVGERVCVRRLRLNQRTELRLLPGLLASGFA
jgi:hypothetical protein